MIGPQIPGKKLLVHRRWTYDAILCLKRGAVCSGCMYENYFTAPDKCHMKEALIGLTRQIGVPRWHVGPTIIED